MESENKRTEAKSKNSILRNYLLPITLISSIVVSGIVGYASSHWGNEKSIMTSAEMNAVDEEMAMLKKEMTEAREQSLETIEMEIPKIMNGLETYDEDIKLISESIEVLEKSIAPLRKVSDKLGIAISIVSGANTVARVPYVDKFSNELEVAQVKLAEIDTVLLNLEKLTMIQNELQASQEKLRGLYEDYQKENNTEQLVLIDQELNSNLIYRIEDLKNLTNEAHELLEFSSDVVETTNQVQAFLNAPGETSKELIKAVQIWKKDDNKAEAAGVDEEVVKDIETSREEIQDLPDKLAQQSRETLTSIHIIQRELQTVEITEMVIGE